MCLLVGIGDLWMGMLELLVFGILIEFLLCSFDIVVDCCLVWLFCGWLLNLVFCCVWYCRVKLIGGVKFLVFWAVIVGFVGLLP